MQNIKLFESFVNEEYNAKKHDDIEINRKLNDTKFVKNLSKFISIIDDLSRLDFKALKHSFDNKTGFRKLCKVFTELGMLKKLKNDDDKLSFEDLKKYGFNATKILRYLNDEDVIEYIKHDNNVKKKLHKLDSLISFLEEYVESKKK